MVISFTLFYAQQVHELLHGIFMSVLPACMQGAGGEAEGSLGVTIGVPRCVCCVSYLPSRVDVLSRLTATEIVHENIPVLAHQQ
jgi:hypothetical protein